MRGLLAVWSVRTIFSPFTKEYRAQVMLIGLSQVFGLPVTGRHTINIKMFSKAGRTVPENLLPEQSLWFFSPNS